MDLMKPDIDWMRRNYDEMNDLLFNGELGECSFGFNNRGSRVLGVFRISNSSVRVDPYSRRMYIDFDGGYFSGSDRIWIYGDNFVEKCCPRIDLNLNYSATEEAWLGVLVHEMVHYYDYMNGICPKQAHGPNFRSISMMVSSRSNGRFSVQRLANAEVMRNFELSDKMVASKKRRIENKKARTVAVFVYKKDGNIEMTLTSSNSVISQIYGYYVSGRGVGKAREIITSTDPELIEMLYSHGYKKLMRTWRYWNIAEKSWSGTIKNYEYKTEYLNESKILKGGYINMIIEGVIDDYVNEIDDDGGIRISDINLGLYSPFELMK